MSVLEIDVPSGREMKAVIVPRSAVASVIVALTVSVPPVSGIKWVDNRALVMTGPVLPACAGRHGRSISSKARRKNRLPQEKRRLVFGRRDIGFLFLRDWV